MISKYTDYTGKNAIKIDSLIDKYMQIIIQEVKNKIDSDNLISIVLIGGFARREGSVLIMNNQLKLMNDFDIFIITKTPLKIDLKQLSLECLKKCNINSNFSFKQSTGTMQFYIDFRNLTLGELEKIPPFIKYFEIRNSAKTIYGKDVLDNIPDYKVSDIPLEEGLRHILNRASLLLEYSVPSYEKIGQQEKETAVFFIGKCYLSIAEALLLYSGEFISSYKKRAHILNKTLKEKFPDLLNTIPDLQEKIEFHTALKLRPSLENIDIKKLWFETRGDVINVLAYYLNLLYHVKMQVNDKSLFAKELEKILKKFLLKEYLAFYLKSKKLRINKMFFPLLNKGAQFYLNFLFLKEFSKIHGKPHYRVLFSTIDPAIKLYSALIPCLFAISPNNQINESLCLEASKRIKRVFPVSIPGKNLFLFWKELCSDYTEAFRIYQFLKI